MGQYDRYVLRQLMTYFGFFSLVLVSVYWVNSAILLFDSLINDGQSVGVFLELSALTLPGIIQLILPVASFVAVLYFFNRMISDSELVVLQTAGLSAFRLLRPVLAFGLLMALFVAVLANGLAPLARGQLTDRQAELRADVTGQLLRAGVFVHPSRSLTLYVREISDLGELRDIFLQDSTNPSVEVTYTATRALLLRGESGPRLVMFDGLALSLDQETGRLSTVSFSDFAYDVAGLSREARTRRLNIREMPTLALVRAGPAQAEAMGLRLSLMRAEGHGRISQAFYALAVPLIAASTLMLGTFSRFGVWRQIMLAVAVVLPMQIVGNAGEALVRRDPEAWPAAYAQPMAALIAALILVGFAMRRRRGWRRSVPA